MKKLLALALILFATTAQAESFEEKNAIIVSGIGEVEVPVDYVNINLSINTRNKELAAAKSENQKNYNTILSSLEKLGIKKDAIKSNFVSINPSYIPCYPTKDDPTPSCDQTKIDFYEANRAIGIKLEDLTKYDQVIESLTKNGASSVNTGSFEIKDVAKQRDKARDLAIESAKSKAAKVATKLGVELGTPIRFESVEDQGHYPMPQMSRMANVAMAYDSSTTDTGAPGSKKIVVTATIAYAIK